MFDMTCSLRGYVQKMCRLYTGKDSLHMRLQPSYSLDNLHILPIQPPIFVLLRKTLIISMTTVFYFLLAPTGAFYVMMP